MTENVRVPCEITGLPVSALDLKVDHGVWAIIDTNTGITKVMQLDAGVDFQALPDRWREKFPAMRVISE